MEASELPICDLEAKASSRERCRSVSPSRYPGRLSPSPLIEIPRATERRYRYNLKEHQRPGVGAQFSRCRYFCARVWNLPVCAILPCGHFRPVRTTGLHAIGMHVPLVSGHERTITTLDESRAVDHFAALHPVLSTIFRAGPLFLMCVSFVRERLWMPYLEKLMTYTHERRSSKMILSLLEARRSLPRLARTACTENSYGSRAHRRVPALEDVRSSRCVRSRRRSHPIFMRDDRSFFCDSPAL